MSKIQKALQRIQKSGPAKTQTPASAEVSEDTLQVAKLVMREGIADGKTGLSTNEQTLVVDQKALQEAGLIAPDYHSELLANQYRSIKRPLVRHAFGKRATKIEDGNLIMVTSAVSGEGKTFSSINLALSMAQERDHSVVLVDADVAKPHVSDIFGVPDEPGLLDLLEDDSLIPNSLIMSTDVPGLHILPAGQPRPNATELLASSRMDKIARYLSVIDDEPIIIFDSPPLLQTNESSVVASLVGQVLLIVRSGHTSQEAVMSALTMLGDDSAVNLVLNQVRNADSELPYGYGYGYGYGADFRRDGVPDAGSAGEHERGTEQ